MRADQLDEPTAAEHVSVHVEVELAARGRLQVREWARRDLKGLSAHGVVDLAAQLVTDDDVHDHRREDDRKGNGSGGDERQPRAEAHVVRRAYPTPRTVWMRRGLPPASVLRRRYPM